MVHSSQRVFGGGRWAKIETENGSKAKNLRGKGGVVFRPYYRALYFGCSHYLGLRCASVHAIQPRSLWFIESVTGRCAHQPK